MKKMKKLVASLLALGCIFAVGGFAACDKGDGSGTNAQQGLGKLELNIQTHTMLLNKTVSLKAERRDVEVEGVTWSSSDTAVATVDNNGVVTSVGFGETTITATVGKETATCLVRVPEVSTDGVVFADKEVKLTVGGEKALDAMVTPMIASNKAVTWKSADEAIATIDANGKVTGVAEGETTVTVTTVDGGKTATCKIIVGKAIETFALSETEITLVAGYTSKVTPIITPADAVIQDLVWTSSDDEIAVYSGMAVVGVSEGTATLTATTVDGGKTASVTVTVLPYISVTSVAFDKEVMNAAKGTEVQLNATVLPADATNSSLKWTSSDMGIATVDANGLVTLCQEGSVTITATSVADSEMFDSVEINVIGAQATLKNEDGTAEGNFTLNAYGVNEVKFNGTPLEASEYTYENNVLTIVASVLAAKTETEMNTLTIISAENGDAEVSIQFYDHYYENFSKGSNTALVGSNVAGNTYFYGSVQTVDGNGCFVWGKNTTSKEALFYFSNTSGNWLDQVRADKSIVSISFEVKAGNEGKVPTLVRFTQWGSKEPEHFCKGEVGENGWVTFTIPVTDYNNPNKYSTGEYAFKIWYNEEKTDVPSSLYFDNFRVNYAQEKEPYLVDFEEGSSAALVGSNVDGDAYFSGSVVALDGSQCYRWTKTAVEPSFYFSKGTDTWLDSVRADDTIESFSFDVKAGDAGKTPTIAFFCQWGSDKNYVTGVDKGNGWVTFTIPATDYNNPDKYSAGEYWMKVWYNAERTDIPTSLYFDNFRVNYVQA